MNYLLKLLQKTVYIAMSLRTVSIAALSLIYATAATATPIIDSVTTTHDANNLYISTLFAPGTLDPTDSLLSLYIDADQNSTTGNFGGIAGAEYLISFSS